MQTLHNLSEDLLGLVLVFGYRIFLLNPLAARMNGNFRMGSSTRPPFAPYSDWREKWLFFFPEASKIGLLSLLSVL